MLLGVVAGGDVVAPRDRAAVGLRLAGEDPQQARLAGPVEAEHEQPLAAPEVERDVGEDRRPAVRLGAARSTSMTVRPGVGGGGKRTLQHLVGPHVVDLVGLEAGDPLLHAVGGGGLRRLGAEAVDELLQPGDLLGLPGGHLRLPLLVAGARLAVLRVRALVLDEVAGAGLVGTVEVQHAGDRLVEQVEVVADDEQGAAVGPQEAHQPLLGVDVEVVRRLVEAQHVAAREQDPGQLDAPPLAARQHADRVLDAVRADAETGGQGAGLAVGGVAAVRAELLLGTRVAADVALVRAAPPWRCAASRCARARRRSRARTGCGRPRCGRRARRRCAGPAAGTRTPPCARRARPTARSRRRARGTGWSCRRRCARPGRPCPGA